MLNNILLLLPNTKNIHNKDELISSLLFVKEQLDNKKNIDKVISNKIKNIIDILINKLDNYKITINEYMEIKKELIGTDNDRLYRLIDSYIYVLYKDNDLIKNKVNSFINVNNLNVLEDRCVLIRYNESRPIIYRNYTRNMEYLDIFKFLRYIDGRYLLLVNKIIDHFGFYDFDKLKDKVMYDYSMDILEKELSFLKNSEMTYNLYELYKEDLLKRIGIYAYNRYKREKSKEFNDKVMYFKKSAQMTLAKKAKQKLKYGNITRNLLGD